MIKCGGTRSIAVFSIFLSLDACVPMETSADGLTWQTVQVNTESIQTSNEIKTQPNITSPCQMAPALNQAPLTGPPAVSKFGELDLNNYSTGVAWSPDEKYIATSEDYDRILKILSFPSLKLLHTIDKGQPGHLTNQNLPFTHDGKYLISSSIIPYHLPISSALSIFNTETGLFYKNVPGYKSAPSAALPFDLELSPDGRFLFVSFISDNSNVYVYDTSTWLMPAKVSISLNTMTPGPGPNQMTMVQYAPIRKPRPSFSDFVYELIVWDGASRAPEYETTMFPMLQFPFGSMTYDSSACDFYFGSSNDISGYSVKVWDAWSNKIFDLQTQKTVADMAISANFHTLAYITDLSQFQLLYFEATPNGPVSELMSMNDIESPFSLSFSPDGRFLATAGDNKVVIYRIGSK